LGYVFIETGPIKTTTPMELTTAQIRIHLAQAAVLVKSNGEGENYPKDNNLLHLV
jgi:hypothetical protein